MLIVATAVAFLFFGWECACRLARDRESAPLERLTWALCIAFGVWLGTLWIFALLHLLTPAVLLTRTAIVGCAAVVMRGRRGAAARDFSLSGPAIGVLVLIVAWCAFILWRGAIIPPLSHDALSYHLPKAVFYAREGGFHVIDALDARARNLPVNYELLLSELVAIDGSDRYTEWLSTIFYAGLIVTAGALAQRWWPRRGYAVAMVCLLTAGVPVVLLHSGAHKNDIMTAFFIVAGLVTAGRWLTTRERFALLLSIASLAIAVGTKPHAAVAALALVPFLAWRWWPMPNRWRELAIAVVFACAAFLLLGGAAYINMKQAVPPAAQSVPAKVFEVKGPALPIAYGDWSNLWQGPYVLLAAPFSRLPTALRVPWEEEPWFWRRYEIYISHAGVPFALCALALPIVLLRFRREEGPSFERVAVLTACAITTVIMLPVVFSPHGFYAISLPRYVAFLYPVIFAWVVPPLMNALSRAIAAAIFGAALFSFFWYAQDNIVFDVFVPLDYIIYVGSHPGTRVIPFDANRGASIVDRAAGPNDSVAIEAAYGTWIQPAFGAKLTRPVHLMRTGASIADVPADADWVVVDRAYDVVWGHPDFRDLSQVRRYLLRGRQPGGFELAEALRRDRRFKAVFYNARRNQAVFRRLR